LVLEKPTDFALPLKAGTGPLWRFTAGPATRRQIGQLPVIRLL